MGCVMFERKRESHPRRGGDRESHPRRGGDRDLTLEEVEIVPFERGLTLEEVEMEMKIKKKVSSCLFCIVKWFTMILCCLIVHYTCTCTLYISHL